MNNASEARIEESISAPNAAPTGSPATDDAIPDTSAAQASVSSESSAQNFARMPRVSERFSTPMDDAAEQSVREEHTPPASPETSASTASTSSEADAVAGPARKVLACPTAGNNMQRPRRYTSVLSQNRTVRSTYKH